MSVFPPPNQQPSSLQFSLLSFATANLQGWEFENLSAPYWRLYWNTQSGAEASFNGQSFQLAPGTLTIIPPDTAFKAHLAQSPVEHFYVHFTLLATRSILPPGVYQVKPDSSAAQRLTTLKNEIRKEVLSPSAELEMAGVCLNALLQIPAGAWKVRLSDERMQKALDKAALHPGEFSDNTALAAEAGLSVNGFIRLFTQIFNESPQRYLMRRRIEQAGILLHNSPLSIEQIAERCGFWDRNYFTKMFKKYREISPGAFRKQVRHPC